MKEIITYMASYSSAVNYRIFGILGELNQAQLEKNHGSRFKNMFGVLNHIIFTDVILFSLLDSVDPVLVTEKMTELGSLRIGYDSISIDDVAELEIITNDIEAELKGLVENIGDEQLMRIVPALNLTMYQTLAHVFTHRAHHRGELKLMLDATGDFPDIAMNATEIHIYV